METGKLVPTRHYCVNDADAKITAPGSRIRICSGRAPTLFPCLGCLKKTAAPPSLMTEELIASNLQVSNHLRFGIHDCFVDLSGFRGQTRHAHEIAIARRVQG